MAADFKKGDSFTRTKADPNAQRMNRQLGYVGVVKNLNFGGVWDMDGYYHAFENIEKVLNTVEAIASVEAEIYDAEKRLADLHAKARQEAFNAKLAEYSVGKKVQHHRNGLIYTLVYRTDSQYVILTDTPNNLQVIEARHLFDDFAIVS